MLNESLKNTTLFTPTEEKLAAHILTMGESLLHLSIGEVAESAYVSQATVTRLCRKLGISGFREFKIQYAAELQKEMNRTIAVDANIPFHDSDSNLMISKKISELTQKAVIESQKRLTSGQLELAVRLIDGSERCFVFANGDSYIGALSFQNKMIKINKNVILTPVQGEQCTLAVSAGRKDSAILISYSGRKNYIVEVARLLKQNGAKLIVVTGDADSTLARFSDVCFHIPCQENEYSKLTPFASQTAAEYVLNVLYACLFKKEYKKNLERQAMCAARLSDIV